MFGKFVSKLIQSLPTWEVTKYYGRVCMYQLKCLKYKVQTSEAWFNFKCKFMPGSLRQELECEDMIPKVKDEQATQKLQKKELPSEMVTSQKQAKGKRSSTSLKDIKDSSYIVDEFVTASKSKKTREKETCQENENYSVHDEYARKKPRKVKQARQ